MGFLTLSIFGIKGISFFLVPLYTSVLTTSEYGIYDVFNTTVSLLIPFLTLNIKESTIRFALSEDYSKKEVFSISLKYSMYSVFYFLTIILINHFFKISEVLENYKYYFLLMFISYVIQGIVTNFVRGLDRLKMIAISTVVCSITIIILNILFLLPFKMGLRGYFLANVLGPIVQVIYLVFSCHLLKYVGIKKLSNTLHKEMIQYSTPMIANSTAWWINSVSDRYIIILMRGASENGIYSVASKISTIVDMFQSIFSQAWTLSAVKEFDSRDSSGFFSRMYGLYNMCMTVVSSGVIVVSRLLAKFLYANDFYAAWRYVPFLIIAVLFGALAGYFGAIFSAVKDSKAFAYSTLAGATVNVVLNIVLVYYHGALGAGISTAISYAIIYCLRLHKIREYIKLRIRLCRDWCGYIILGIQTILFLQCTKETIQLYLIQILLLILVVSLYKDQYKFVIEKIKHMGKAQ